VGKTTISFNLAGALSRMGYRVLAVDLDGQSHLTTCFGVSLDDQEQVKTLYNLFLMRAHQRSSPSLKHRPLADARLLPRPRRRAVDLLSSVAEPLEISPPSNPQEIKSQYDFVIRCATQYQSSRAQRFFRRR
jgi:cellulose biosynthesis protein BcsQ